MQQNVVSLFSLHVGEAELFPHIIVWFAKFSQSGVLLSDWPSSGPCSPVCVLEVSASLDVCCQVQISERKASNPTGLHGIYCPPSSFLASGLLLG